MTVEAKNENFKNGIAQTTAEMLATRIFNERKGLVLPEIYGAVTTGDIWRFSMLKGNTVYGFFDLFDESIHSEIILPC